MQGLSFPLSPIPRCDAFNLMCALDAYDVASARLVESWLDMAAYTEFNRQIEPIREHGVTIPALTVLSLQLVIAHSELVSTMWQQSSVGVSAARLRDVMARHTVAVNALRVAAARLLRND